jgi:membrane associated rhomboid family serine protease
MIPVRDVIPSRTRPWVTVTLIVVNALIFASALLRDPEARLDFFFSFGLVPSEAAWLTIVTSLGLHNGWVHLISNVLALWIFGENVEDRMGHARFFAFYLICGTAGGLAGAWATPGVVVPIVGSGAAVAGVIAAHLALFPQSRILVLMPFVVITDVIEAPAWLLAAVWMVLQVVGDAGRVVVSPGDTAFVAWTHAAGSLAGLLAVWVFRRPERLRVEWWG